MRNSKLNTDRTTTNLRLANVAQPEAPARKIRSTTRTSKPVGRTNTRTNLTFVLLATAVLNFACKKKVETIHPEVASISESVYASGIVKSSGQYDAFLTVSGIISEVYVAEGDFVKKGAPILSVANETQKLNRENAALSAQISDYNANQGKLNDAKLLIEVSAKSMLNDSALYFRQKTIWESQLGTKIDFERRALAYEQSKANYYSAKLKYDELKRQLNFSSAQSKKTLLISSNLEKDYTLRSNIDGIVYKLLKYKGEIVSPQAALATIGSPKDFILEMQIDERDILKIRKNQDVFVSMDSYKGKIFNAKVSRILPMMNERSKTFIVEAVFSEKPEILYPNLTFEASILLQTKEKALLIPRNYLQNDSLVSLKNGSVIAVKTGLRDYQKIEIVSGLNATDELIMPK